MKFKKKIIFFVLIGLSVLGIPVFAFSIFNKMVSLKYETNSPKDCISLVSGQDLCLAIQIHKGLVIAFFATIILLLVFRKHFFNDIFTSEDLPK